MLHEQTMSKLHAMKLFGMSEALEEQRRQARSADLGFEDRLGLLVERQWIWKENRSLATRLQHARLKTSTACIEDIDYRHPRCLQRSVVENLATSEWVRYRQHCIVTGPTGSGKSYLGCALGNKACRDGYRVRYWSTTKLLRELSTASADGSLARLLKQLERTDLLILDDWGLEQIKEAHGQLLLEIVEDRQDSGSVLITSQFAVGSWHERIGNPTVADALLDRLVHHAHRIELKGESMRKTKTTRSAPKS
jgi:DNA replication protein DnaC